MKVLFHYAAGPRLRAEVEARCDRDTRLVYCPEGPEEPFYSEVADSEVIWHVLWPITAAVIARAPKLRLIQKIGVGVNTIDLAAAKQRGIAVCNMPGTNSRAVAEMTLLLMLNVLRRQYGVERALRAGQWIVDEATRESFGELAGRTVGLVGFGAVPQLLAPVLEAMGARVVYTATAAKAVRWEFLPLARLLAEADIVSLHVPLVEATTRLIDRQRLAGMKRGAILVNTARGALVDEGALHEALASGHLGGAGLDVFHEEPTAAANPLLQLPNVAVSPHLAWLTLETWQRSIDVALHNVRAIRDGHSLAHRVA
ncbi:MAG: 2-hydroxyacid dehydrogenase family protein [Gammaproteobacteria bacterium]|nr:MAG: hydroxyacid dehydrogenase [Pseudomonadota bacterium]MBC6945561.1 hydroxyacid dehydrogenase [Gammaproteobacteria bacterium]MCE7895909.1 hydroxyacid dehydrogenase [Gammaproteobacteria bacterium PRO8]MDL1880623.1 hydroxyacid dehydrogenase [Gammaproteobacteria bacterium PRO2]MCL4777135.1 2-hydroxyacid dehydrogenase [Gammaproteobacteria bacterium]